MSSFSPDDMSSWHTLVGETVKSSDNPISGMDRLIMAFEPVSPSPVWAQIRKLDFNEDLKYLHDWLANNLKKEPPEDEINAFYFGIYNPIVNGKESRGLYISGSTRYDPGDNSDDWACLAPDSYEPNDMYADSKCLQNIYRLLSENKIDTFGEYILILGYAGLSIKNICDRLDQKLLLGNRDWRAVAVGFDEGDMIKIKEYGNKA